MSKKLPTIGRVTNTVPKAKPAMSKSAVVRKIQQVVVPPKYPKPLTAVDWYMQDMCIREDAVVLANNEAGVPVYYFCQVETWQERGARLRNQPDRLFANLYAADAADEQDDDDYFEDEDGDD